MQHVHSLLLQESTELSKTLFTFIFAFYAE